MLKELLAQLKAKNSSLGALMSKSDLTTEELAALEALTGEITALDNKIKALKAAEVATALAGAIDVGTEVGNGTEGQTGTGNADKVEARPLKGMPSAMKIGFIAASMVRSFHQGRQDGAAVLDDMEKNGLGELAAKLAKANRNPLMGKSLNTMSMAQGGVLVPTDEANDFIDLLRVETVFLQIPGMQRRPMPNGNLHMIGAASGSSAEYRGEGARAIVSEPTFMDLNLSSKILSGIVPMTDQLLSYSSIDVQAWAEQDLRDAIAEKMDATLLRGQGVSNRPRGIMWDPATVRNTSTLTSNATTVDIESEARRMEQRMMIDANIRTGQLCWLMSKLMLGNLADRRTTNNEIKLYPELQGDNPTWRNKPVLDSAQIPANLGIGGNEAELALVHGPSIILGEAVPLRLKVSNQASVFMNGQWVSLFQQGLVAVMAETEHDVGVRRVGAVQVVDGILWGH